MDSYEIPNGFLWASYGMPGDSYGMPRGFPVDSHVFLWASYGSSYGGSYGVPMGFLRDLLEIIWADYRIIIGCILNAYGTTTYGINMGTL